MLHALPCPGRHHPREKASASQPGSATSPACLSACVSPPWVLQKWKARPGDPGPPLPPCTGPPGPRQPHLHLSRGGGAQVQGNLRVPPACRFSGVGEEEEGENLA